MTCAECGHNDLHDRYTGCHGSVPNRFGNPASCLCGDPISSKPVMRDNDYE